MTAEAMRRDAALDQLQRNVATTREALAVLRATHPLGVVESEAKRTEMAAGSAPSGEDAQALTGPVAVRLLQPPPGWGDIARFAHFHPDAVAVRSFQYMKPSEGFPEMSVRCLHVTTDDTFVIVLPLEPLSCEVGCDVCRERPNLGELCPVCHGTKRRTMTTADVQRFVDAGDRYGMSGTFWRLAARTGE